MTNQQPKRGISKLISDPYREWSSDRACGYEAFGNWIDLQLADLEAKFQGWETPGYGHWRRTLGNTRNSQEAEAAE